MRHQVRTRFAPSPTGYLHIGGLRTALYTYLFAKRSGGVFILRIEDTDQERLVEGATELIYQSMRQAGLFYDEGPDVGGDYGPYIQTERRDIYKKYAMELVERGGAYRCFCTRERLDDLRAACEAGGETFKYDKHCKHLSPQEIQDRIGSGEPFVIRQDMPKVGQTTFSDMVFGEVTVDNETLDDTVLLKSDGLPTYNFANVVDDHLMGITHIMRGTEYLSSTPKYNQLYEKFGWPVPIYIHLPPVMKDQKRKLSKRYGDPSFEDLLSQGFLKDAIINYIALLGWSPGTSQEFFTLDELVEAFDIKGINKSPSIFDPAKLTWFNAEYIRRMTPGKWKAVALPYLERVLDVGKIDVDILLRVLQPRVEILTQIPDMVAYLADFGEDFDPHLYFHKKMRTSVEQAKEVLPKIFERLQSLTDWTEESLHGALLSLASDLQLKNGQVLWPARIAVTGMGTTAGGAIEIAAILGREETLRRMKLSLEKLG
ncbi:MAG: glutamate--tRNA ligase [Christensenellales bacterium]|jgi:glutamyl-tRNA synthetase